MHPHRVGEPPDQPEQRGHQTTRTPGRGAAAGVATEGDRTTVAEQDERVVGTRGQVGIGSGHAVSLPHNG